MVVRTLGLGWVAVLAAVAWDQTPSFGTVPAPVAPPAQAAAPSAPVRAPASLAAADAPRVVYQGTVAAAPAAPRPAAPARPAVESAPAAPSAPIVEARAPVQASVQAPVQAPAPVEPAPAEAGRVDLNTAPLAALNALQGGGLIGRAIVAGRPYASPEDLLAKRVVNRATYERIKDQVAAR